MEILKFNPCKEAVEFRKEFKTFKEAWEACPRGDWMLWIAKKLDVNIRQLTYAKALCAETVIHLMKDQLSIDAIKTAKRFGRYKATKEQLNDAHAAYVAAAYYDAYDAYTDEKNRLATANICRKHLTKTVFSKLKNHCKNRLSYENI